MFEHCFFCGKENNTDVVFCPDCLKRAFILMWGLRYPDETIPADVENRASIIANIEKQYSQVLAINLAGVDTLINKFKI